MKKTLLAKRKDGRKLYKITTDRGAFVRYEIKDARACIRSLVEIWAPRLLIAGLVVGLVGSCIITGEPLNVETCHGSSKAKCLEQQGVNTKSSYAHRGEVVSPFEDVQAWTK